MPIPHLAPTGRWMATQDSIDAADWVMVGLPYDGTTSYRPGTRFGPAAIREASWSLETYSLRLDADLEEDAAFYDAGELELPLGNREASLAAIEAACAHVLALGKRWLGVGGEHLVTLPALRAYVNRYTNLALLHIDAHTDLRHDYLGEPLSHATVVRRAVELIDPARLVQIGLRSGTREEFAWVRAHGTLVADQGDVATAVGKLADLPVYLTLDLDVLDPSIFPGTGTPEPGGMQFNELIEWLLPFRGLNVVGADVVELSPPYDPTGVSPVVAAKVIRELLLMLA